MTLRIDSILMLALASAGFYTGAMAQTAQGDHSSHAAPAAKSSPASADSAMGDGLVKKIDKAAKTVTIAHGALPNGMPPMTMAYRVKDPAWLDSMRVGQKIRFATDPADNGMTVLRFEPVK